jgi:hypothetical protein
VSRFFLECSRSVDFRWQLPRDFLLPEQFRELFCGGFSLSLEALPEHERARFGGEQTFPNPNDPYDVTSEAWRDPGHEWRLPRHRFEGRTPRFGAG